MAQTSTKRKRRGPYVVGEKCSRQCSLHPDNLDFAELTTAWYNDDWTIEAMVNKSESLGRKLSTAALSRHRRHLVEQEEESEVPVGGDGNVDHLEVLQKIIAAGAKRAHLWRVGPNETMKALDMYYKLTNGSAMGDLLSALMGADDLDEEGDEDVGTLSPAEAEARDGVEG